MVEVALNFVTDIAIEKDEATTFFDNKREEQFFDESGFGMRFELLRMEKGEVVDDGDGGEGRKKDGKVT